MGARGPKKGSPRRGGRQPGTPNKRTLDLVERLHAMDFDPIDMAVKIINDKTGMKKGEIVNACIRIAEFLYPKRKPADPPPPPKEVADEIVYTTEWGNRREASDAKEDAE